MSSDLGGQPDSETKSDMPKLQDTKDTETKENVNTENADTMPDAEKNKTLPEPIRVGGKDMPRLPPIGMAELTSILQGPNMPSQKLMKEVTEKIRLKNDESGSDDGSVSGGGGGVGIRGIFDCILEVSLFHQDSEDESDREGDEIFVRELPCRFCKKIFGSTMNLKTHVLMTHSQEDPSVLNIKNQSRYGGRKERMSPIGRTKSIEGREKEGSIRSRKRSSQDYTLNKEEKSLKRVRSRHNSKEQSSKVENVKDKPCDTSSMPATSADLSEATSVSSQRTTRQISHETDNAKSNDLESSAVILAKSSEQLTHAHEEDTPSKTAKRKSSAGSSSTRGSSSSAKKAKRSQSQSGETKDDNIQLRRSSRRK